MSPATGCCAHERIAKKLALELQGDLRRAFGAPTMCRRCSPR
jgi:hypothetical protein